MLNSVPFQPQQQVIEHSAPDAFYARTGRWLQQREGENCVFLQTISELLGNVIRSPFSAPRMFTVEENNGIAAAAMFFTNGNLLLTWAVPEAIDALVAVLAVRGLAPTAVFGPHHVASHFAEAWTRRAGGTFALGREERIMQVSDLSYAPPASGRLKLAMPGDLDLLGPWFEGFLNETKREISNLAPRQLCAQLVQQQKVFIWKNSQALGMAVRAARTPRGEIINLIFVPPELRGRGHGRDLIASMAKDVLASGLRYCFMLATAEDLRTQQLGFSIGARTVSVFLRCDLRRSTGPQFYIGR